MNLLTPSTFSASCCFKFNVYNDSILVHHGPCPQLEGWEPCESNGGFWAITDQVDYMSLTWLIGATSMSRYL